MGKVIKVTNGTDTFDVNEDKLSLAVKDGFRPTERVIVANSKTGETYEVNPENFHLALKDGFAFQDIVKKKVGGASSAFGGVGKAISEVGSGLSPSDGEDLSDPPIYSIKPVGGALQKMGTLKIPKKEVFPLKGTPATKEYQDIQNRYAKANEVEVDADDPVRSLITPIENKIAERRNKPVSSSTSTPVSRMAGNIEASQLVNAKREVEGLRFNDAKEAEDFLDTKLDKSKLVRVGQPDMTKAPSLDDFSEESVLASIPKENMTAQVAAKQYLENRKVRNILSTSSSLEDAALKYAMSKGDVTGKQITELSGDVPNSMKGNMIMDFVQNGDVQELASKDSKLAQDIKEEMYNFPQHYPSAAIRVLTQILSAEREKRGFNNGIINFTSPSTSDEIVDELVASGELPLQYKALYQDPSVRFIVNAKLKTPGLIENIGTGIEQGVTGIGKTVADVTGVRDLYSDKKDRLFNALDKQYSDFAFKPKGLMHQITTSGGNIVGQMLPMLGGGAGLRGAGLVKNASTANSIMAGVQTFGENRDRALVDLPGESEEKQFAYATLNTGIEVALANVMNDAKLANSLVKKASPEIKTILNKFTNKEITAAAAKEATQNVFGKLLTASEKFVKGTTSTAAKEATEESATQLLQTANNQVFGGEPITTSQALEDAFDVFTTTFLGGLVMGVGGGIVEVNKNPEMPNLIYEMASNPDKYIDIIEGEAAVDKEYAKDVDKKVENLQYVASVKNVLDARPNMKENEKKVVLLKSLSQKILSEQNEAIPDKSLRAENDKLIAEFEIEKQIALNPKMTNTEIVQMFYDKDILDKGSMNTLEGGEGKFNEANIGKYLKEVAQQANNLDENWEPHETEKPASLENIPIAIIELANRRWAKEIDAAEEKRIPPIGQVRERDIGTEILPEETLVTEQPIPVQEGSELDNPALRDVQYEESLDKEQSKFKEDGWELWQMPIMKNEKGGTVKSGDWGVAESGELGTAVSIIDIQPKSIKRALDEGLYEKEIQKGKMSAGYAKRIIESAGLEVPQDILIDAGLQKKKVNKKSESLLSKEQTPESIPVERGEGVLGGEEVDVRNEKVPLYQRVAKVLEDNGFDIEKESSKKSFSEYIKVNIKGTSGNYTLKIRISDHNQPRGSYATADIRSNKTIDEAIDIIKNSREEFKELKIKEQSLSNETPNKQEVKTEPNETTQASIVTDEPKPAIEEMAAEETTDKDSGAAGKEPPKTPPGEEVGEGESGKLNEKGILNRLFNATNVPQAAKEGFQVKGLKYATQSREEAAELGKAIVKEFGIDDAVTMAEANRFKGGVRGAIFAESLTQLKELEDKATTPEDKLEAAKMFADIAIRYDEFSREQGRDISQIDFFYKKSPLGIIIAENAKRKGDFDTWAKPKDKSWEEFFDEMMKEPEFEAVVKEKIKEELKKERAESRAKRVEKVKSVFNKAREQFKGGAAYSTIIPPKIITAAIDLMEGIYMAGEKVVEVVQKGVDYVSEQMGNAPWDKEKFRKEWEDKLNEQEPKSKKTLTDAELKMKVLDRFRKKLKGLTEKQKDEVIRRSHKKLIENDALDYQDFRDIIAQVVGRGELTPEQMAKMKEMVVKLNNVEEAAKKAREERTDAAMVDFRKAEIEAGRASKELNELFYNKPDIIKRLTSIMQLSTLGIPSLINNPIYNIWNQATLRFPIGLINDLIDRGISLAAKATGKNYDREYNVLETQAEFWKKLGFGTKEAIEQLMTGLNRQDYLQKEIYGQQIRPLTAMKDLVSYAKGEKTFTKTQLMDKAIQATVGVPAEVVARFLNIGDKPQRFAAEGSQAAAFAKTLGLQGMDYKLFIEFPREEAYQAYKAQGLSDEVAGQKADYIKEAIIKEGERSTFQQDNLLNDVLTRAFSIFGGKDSGTANLLKTLTISPYIKIPSNAFWSFYNMLNPEVAIIQTGIHAARAKSYNTKGEITKAKLQSREARYWMAHAIVGMAMRAVVIALAKAGIFTPASDDEESKKERDAISYFDKAGTVQIGDMKISNRWFGQWGMMGNAIAKKYRDATPEQREAQDEFWNIVFGGMEREGLKELQNGIFANSSSILQSLDSGNPDRYLTNTINMMANIIQPAAIAQINRASLDEVPNSRGDDFLDKLNKNFAQRSVAYRRLFKVQIDSKKDIWGQPIPKGGNVISRLFGVSKANPQIFARPIYDSYLETGDSGFLPPAVPPVLNGKKLNTKQYDRLQQYIGGERKRLIEPYVNDMAIIPEFGLYSTLKDDEVKKEALQYLYEKGRDIGVEKFYTDFPELKPSEKTEQELEKGERIKNMKQEMKSFFE